MVIVKGQRVKNTVIAKKRQPEFQFVDGGAAEGRPAPAPYRPRPVAPEICVIVRYQRFDQRTRSLPDAHKWISHQLAPIRVQLSTRLAAAFQL